LPGVTWKPWKTWGLKFKTRTYIQSRGIKSNYNIQSQSYKRVGSVNKLERIMT
jgi:hypothetical protein